MKYEIIKLNEGWKITDSEGNYLEYIEHRKLAETSFGVVDNKTVDRGNLRTTWKSCGRGKIADKTLDRIIEMNDYFYKNY